MWDDENFDVLDATGTTRTFGSDESGGVHTPVHRMSAPSVLRSGKLTLALTDTTEPLGASAVLTRGLYLFAPISNTGTVWVGPSGVTNADGFPIMPGAPRIWVDIDNVASVFAYGASSDVLYYMGS